MKNIVSKFYVVAAFLCSTAIMFAQPGTTSDDAELNGLEGADNQAPISDYLWVLAVVGFVYAFWKMVIFFENKSDAKQ